MKKNQSGSELYKEAGVDTGKGDALVDWLHADVSAETNPTGSLVSGIGGFAALFRPNLKGMQDPLIVSSTDGVGTKVLLGLETGILRGLGKDLVAMCVNDLYTIGARPMFFLDYYATGKLNETDFRDVLTGIKEGCHQAKMNLIGGETAELPGLYSGRHFDLAGFVVGLVDGATRLGPHRVQETDLLFSFNSSGFHSNGYSLVRKWLQEIPDSSEKNKLLSNLMTPTRIYHEVPELLSLLGTDSLHSLANITGGGISGNLPRVIPQELTCHISLSSIPTPAWMRDFILSKSDTLLAVEEVFNLGAGMIACVAHSQKQKFETACKQLQLPIALVGEVKRRKSAENEVVFH